MLLEQGYLCAYTMLRIDTIDDCHIEHIAPQSQANQPPQNEIDYNNLLACIPSNTPGHRPGISIPYGANVKANVTVDEDSFMSPLHPDVEDRFQYRPDGTVSQVDAAAENTIRVLALNHSALRELRKAAIDERVWGAEILTADQADQLSHRIMDADRDGRIPEFCLAISQVAAWDAGAKRKPADQLG